MENKHNARKLWSIIKSTINRNKSKFQEKFKLNNGSYTTDKHFICETFNDFFINVGPSLSKKISYQNCSPDQFISWTRYGIWNQRIGNSVKFASPGYDNLRRFILKLSLPFICSPLTFISNLSLQERVFPCELKLANVPLFKCDGPERFNNYRSVSVLLPRLAGLLISVWRCLFPHLL